MNSTDRRKKLNALARQDPEFRKAWEAYERAKTQYEKWTRWVPKKLRSLLWTFPGMGHIVYHRMLDLVCEQMVFRDEV